MARIISDKKGTYYIHGKLLEDEILSLAADILNIRMKKGDALTSPQHTLDFLKMELGGLEHEIFGCIFLDNRNQVICFEQLFNGTIDGAAVHPREVVKRTLQLNAAAVIFAHNHPSGVPEPSSADKAITKQLKEALGLVDVRVLDHVIIGGNASVSFAERGYI